MPFYLYQLAYSPEAIKGLVASPSDRAEVATRLIGGLGGKLHHLFFAFGEYDVVVLAEAPDDRTMAAVALAVASSGAVARSKTTKLMTSAEAMEAMRMSADAAAGYRPPMA